MPRVRPAPITAPTTAWDVETGIPIQLPILSQEPGHDPGWNDPSANRQTLKTEG